LSRPDRPYSTRSRPAVARREDPRRGASRRVGQVSARQVGANENRTLEVCTAKVRSCEIRAGELRIREDYATESGRLGSRRFLRRVHGPCKDADTTRGEERTEEEPNASNPSKLEPQLLVCHQLYEIRDRGLHVVSTTPCSLGERERDGFVERQRAPVVAAALELRAGLTEQLLVVRAIS